MNMLDATIESANGGLAAKIGDQTIALGTETLEQRPALRGLRRQAGDPRHPPGGPRGRGARDRTLRPSRRLHGRLELREALGSEIMAHFAIKGAHAETDETRELARGRRRRRNRAADRRARRTRRSSSAGSAPRSKSSEGDNVTAVVDTRALHFFDPETGSGIYDSPKGAEA